MAVISALMCVLVLSIAPTWLPGSQNPLSSPTTGTVSGLQLTNSYNNALDSLNTCNSGASAPSNQLSGSPSLGNCWINTTSAPYPVYFHDGAGNWLLRGFIDPSAHLWVPPLGGGTGTIASGPTTDLGSIPQAVVNVTGTTTITSFGTSAAKGTLRVLIFAGSLTLGYNATSLILPTASNITTAVGDAAIALYLGSGNWQVVSYQPASGAALAPVPTGTVLAFAGPNVPNGFIICDGRAISRTTFAALFTAIGTLYGAGDGGTSFNVPDYRGRAMVGVDNMGGTPANRLTSVSRPGGWDGLAFFGGSEIYALTPAQLPAHTHSGTTGTENVGHSHSPSAGQNFVVGVAAGPLGFMAGTGAIQLGETNVTGAESQNHVHSFSGATCDNCGGSAFTGVAPAGTINFMIKSERQPYDIHEMRLAA
jgi:microcystin-dependent protein